MKWALCNGIGIGKGNGYGSGYGYGGGSGGVVLIHCVLSITYSIALAIDNTIIYVIVVSRRVYIAIYMVMVVGSVLA